MISLGLGLYWIYAFNVIVNSALSFFTTVFLVECFVSILRIKHPRIRMLCFFLPFCKICLDLHLYSFSNWSLFHGINPILAETGTRQLSILINPFAGIQFGMLDGTTFSLADVIALSIDPFWIKSIVLFVIPIAVLCFAMNLIRIFREKKTHRFDYT